MAKKTKKHDAEQKNKKGFKPDRNDTEFGQEFGSAVANKQHKEHAKKARKANKTQQKLDR
ncbi:hypothetical protein H0266_14920 [Halobacillus locisalis]|uniref:Uncharacterized protein n=1 Tax=Halobacillus locisalis TaxID=220753 RepID=A0A838CVW0_9BACI|nr:hypothetical protein [Halobacillus locisalis]MBA2176187.1 hypothetical protein [Halobacillus locisalis]